MAIYDCRLSLTESVIDRLSYALKVFDVKNSKVQEDGNHLDLSVHASQSDVDGSSSEDDDNHWKHQAHKSS